MTEPANVDNPRLVLNGRWLTQRVTGTQRYADEVARRLVDRFGSDVALVVPRSAEIAPHLAGARVVRSRFGGVIFEQVALPVLALKWRRSPLVSLAGPVVLARRNQAVVLHDAAVFRHPEGSSALFGMWHRFMYRVASRRVRTLVTVSQFSARELAHFLGIEESRFRIAPCGHEHAAAFGETRPTVALPQGYVLLLGTLAPRKNVMPTVAALREAGIPTVVTGDVGSARVFGAVAQVAPETRAENDGVVFTGRLRDDEIAWLYRHAKALVFPSLYEGFGLPAIEAQVHGCPVVAARAASLPEVLGDSAEWFEPSDSRRAATVVASVVSSPTRGGELREAGFANAARYRWSEAADAITVALGLGRGAT